MGARHLKLAQELTNLSGKLDEDMERIVIDFVETFET